MGREAEKEGGREGREKGGNEDIGRSGIRDCGESGLKNEIRKWEIVKSNEGEKVGESERRLSTGLGLLEG